MQVKKLIERYPLVAYFVLAYAIAWGGAVLVAAAKGFDVSRIDMNNFLLMYLFMLAAPSLSSILLTALLEGKPGLGRLFARLRDWRIEPARYSLLLLVTPVIMLGVLTALTLFVSPAFQPQFVPFAIVAGLLAGFLEEIGWTGFATPRLQARYSLFTSGLILGLLWATWHAAAGYFGAAHTLGSYWLADFVVGWLLLLTPYRILMGFVYKHTQSLPLAQLMHAVFTGSLGLFRPVTGPADGLIWQGAVMVVLWVLVAVVFVTGEQRVLKPLRR